MQLFSHKGLLNGRLKGRALTVGVCATASSGFFLLGYDRMLHEHDQWRTTDMCL